MYFFICLALVVRHGTGNATGGGFIHIEFNLYDDKTPDLTTPLLPPNSGLPKPS